VLLTAAGAIITATALFIVTVGSIVFFRLNRRPGSSGTDRPVDSTGAALRVLTLVGVGIGLGVLIALARTLGG
jgi:hypothetical protein